MNQNKIVGRAIADGMVKFYEYGDGGFTYRFFGNNNRSQESNFFWRVNQQDIDRWELTDEDLVDVVEQIAEAGSIEELKKKLGILPNQGLKYNGIVFRSRTNPKVACHVVFTDMTSGNQNMNFAYGTEHNRNNDYGQDAYLYYYYDIHHVTDPEGQGEDVLGDMATLMYGGMNQPGFVEM